MNVVRGAGYLPVTAYEDYYFKHSMWNFVLYCCAVATFIILYWFHKPKASGSEATASAKQSQDLRQSQSRSDNSIDSPSAKGNIKNKAEQRMSSIRRRKELVERDIIMNLGLRPDERGFEAFCDRFSTFEFVSQALVHAGFCPCDVIVGIDFTASNEWQGKRSFSKTSLHKIHGAKVHNPYQKVLHILGKTLSFISSEHQIHSYGFGDSITQEHSVFPLCKDDTGCKDYREVITAYTHVAKKVQLDGPTNFAPIVDKAIDFCIRTKQYHILVIIMDGQVSPSCEQSTVDAIVRASQHPLSIIAIGIGDGPFGTMFEYDDGLPLRKFDNLQFVNFHRTVTKSKHEAAFALHALMELPDQYKAIQQLGYLTSQSSKKDS